MQIDPSDDPRNSEAFDIYNAASGDTPSLPYHIREELALIRELPKCSLPTPDRDAATQVALATYPAALWIPTFERAEMMEGPEPAWQGWQWGPWEYLLLYLDHDADLPRLSQLTVAAPSHWQLTVADVPMRLRRYAPGDPEWRGQGFAGEIKGFLDEHTNFWAQSVAPTEQRRDELLGAVVTLIRVTDGVGSGTSAPGG